MGSNQHFLQNLYDAFNKREIETIISLMRPDVKWANGLEGGFVYGRDAVREYWTNQFKDIQPELETLKFETDENNRNIVTVHQIIRDLQGNLLADATVQQIFTALLHESERGAQSSTCCLRLIRRRWHLASQVGSCG